MDRCLRAGVVAFLFLFTALAHAASISYTVTPLGGGAWRYEYVVDNDAPGAPIEEFTIYFPTGLYSGLVAALAPGWDILVVQPDAGIPDDGFYDGLVLGAGIAQNGSVSGFAVTFTYHGAGTPGAQDYDIVDPQSFAVLASGMTQAAPDLNRKIAALYVAFFERAADRDGHDFWRAVAKNSGLIDLLLMRLMAGGFANHPSFAAIYGALSDEAYVDAIYLNIGGKVADAAGKAFWLGQIAGGLSRSAFVADFVFGLLEITEQTLQDLVNSGAITEAERQDALARKNRMTNKSVVALAFVNALGAASNLLPGTNPLDPASLAADPAYRASQNIIRAVTQEAASKAPPMTYLDGSPTIEGINAAFGP